MLLMDFLGLLDSFEEVLGRELILKLEGEAYGG